VARFGREKTKSRNLKSPYAQR